MRYQIKTLCFTIIVILLLMGCTTMPEKRYEYYTSGEDGAYNAYGGDPCLQTFTIGATGDNEDFFIKTIKVKLIVGITGDHNVRFYIAETNFLGEPLNPLVDGYLCLKEVNESSLVTGWNSISVEDCHVILNSSTTYALSIHGAPLSPRWCVDTSNATYTGGKSYYSALGSWIENGPTDNDQIFELWGNKQIDDKVTIKSSSESAYRLVSSSEDIYNISAENEEVYDISSEHEQIYNINENN